MADISKITVSVIVDHTNREKQLSRREALPGVRR